MVQDSKSGTPSCCCCCCRALTAVRCLRSRATLPSLPESRFATPGTQTQHAPPWLFVRSWCNLTFEFRGGRAGQLLRKARSFFPVEVHLLFWQHRAPNCLPGPGPSFLTTPCSQPPAASGSPTAFSCIPTCVVLSCGVLSCCVLACACVRVRVRVCARVCVCERAAAALTAAPCAGRRGDLGRALPAALARRYDRPAAAPNSPLPYSCSRIPFSKRLPM